MGLKPLAQVTGRLGDNAGSDSTGRRACWRRVRKWDEEKVRRTGMQMEVRREIASGCDVGRRRSGAPK